MTGPFRFFVALSLFLLPTVMFGGYSLLRLIPKNKLTPEQHAWFRAGHAHAGVLLVMTLVILDIEGRLSLGADAGWAIGALLVGGALAQSGGMFLHMAFGRSGSWSAGNTVTTVGALGLATATLWVAIAVAT